MERTEAARGSFARLVGAAPDEVAVTTSLSAGVAALASGLRFAAPRHKVVTTDLEFPTMGQIWHAQEARGARVVHVPAADDGLVPLEALRARDRRGHAARRRVTHVCYRNGALLDVDAVVRLAHERGALVLLDAYQAVGSLPVDVSALGVDFLAAGVLKYLLGSAGLAFFYCRRESSSGMADVDGLVRRRGLFEMDIHDYSPARDARRFQSGTPPIPSIYAGIAGIELMQEIGIADTRAHVRDLNRPADRGGRRPRRRGRDAAQAGAARRARLRRLDGRARARRGVAARGDRHLVARRQPAHLARTPTTRPRTSRAVLWELARKRGLTGLGHERVTSRGRSSMATAASTRIQQAPTPTQAMPASADWTSRSASACASPNVAWVAAMTSSPS